ncbi:acyl carrier protein [Thermodesulfobacteriota bacterium]
MPEKIKNKFMHFIAQNFMVEKDDIPLDQSLVDEGIIDSFGLFEIIAFIETEYSISIPEDQQNDTNFGTVSQIIDFIEANVNE